MKRSLYFPLLFAICSLVASCGILPNKNLAKRYRNTNNVKLFANAPDPNSFVQVELNSVNLKDIQSQKLTYNLLSLSPEGQAQLIKSFEAKSADKKELMDQLNTNFAFSKENKANVKVISNVVKKSLVFTVNRAQYQKTTDSVTNKTSAVFNLLGDRIAYLELSINLAANSNARFDVWDKYVTDHLTLNLGKVTSAQQWNASLNLNAKSGGEITVGGSNSSEDFDSNKRTGTIVVNPKTDVTEALNTVKTTSGNTNGSKVTSELGGGASLAFQDKYETSLDLSTRILKLSGTLSDKKMVLRQESGPSIDLSGNIVLSIDYVVTDQYASPVNFLKISELYKDNMPIDFSALKTSSLMVLFPDMQSDVDGSMDYNFLYRQVQHGNRHIPEARQKVKFWLGDVPITNNILMAKTKPILIKKEDVRPKCYNLVLNKNEVQVNGVIANFETLSEAAIFLKYVNDLVNSGKSVSNITFNGVALSKANFDFVKIISKNL